VAQLGATIPEDLLTKIDAIEMEEIEGTKNDVVRALLNGRGQRIKVWCTISILNDSLAIDDC
jgi:hypothetical protein